MKKVIKLFIVLMVSLTICPSGYAQKWRVKAHKPITGGIKVPKFINGRIIPPKPTPLRQKKYSNNRGGKTPIVGQLNGVGKLFPSIAPPNEPQFTRDSPEVIYFNGKCLLEKGDTASAIKKFKESAERGWADSQEAYGTALMDGWCANKNEEEGFMWLLKAADKNHFIASTKVGDYFCFELHDTLSAAKYYEMACEYAQSHSSLVNKEITSRICYNLGCFYYYGSGVAKDENKACKHWIHSADLGNIDAAFIIGSWYEEGQVVKKNPQLAIHYICFAAINGHIEAQATVGDFFFNLKDSINAIEWYKIAASNGHRGSMEVLTELYFCAGDNDSTIYWGSKPECKGSLIAQYYVGNAYRNKEDYKNAETWLKEAACQNDAESYWCLACMYYNELNDSIAYINSLRQAADLGWADAINDMGTEYLEGVLVERDMDKAKEYFNKAMEKGNLNSYCNLGAIYFFKEYGMRDYKLAAEYWKKGAELGNPMCQYNYSCVLRKGKGVKKDKRQANQWMILAARNGSEDAQQYLQKKHIDWTTPTEKQPQSNNPQMVMKSFRVVDVDGIGVTVVEE